MSVQLNPSNALGFKRPLTTLVKRSLTITNHNHLPVAFKVKTTAPKLYCVRPNSGRVEPGESVDVSVMLQALREEPPLNAKCKDKFLIQSIFIHPDTENMPLNELWASPDNAPEDRKIHQQKLKVVYLPAEGDRLEEEDEAAVQAAGAPAAVAGSHYDTVRQYPANGHMSTLDVYDAPAQEYHGNNSQSSHDQAQREPSYEAEHQYQQQVPVIVEPAANQPSPPAPPAAPLQEDTTVYHEEHRGPSPEPPAPETFQAQPAEQPVAPAPVPAPAAPAPAPEPIYITRENPVNEELYAKYNLAQAEIDRLKAQIAALAVPPPSELRRRTRKLSDADSAAGSDFQTVIEDLPVHQEGVPLQVVVIIALGVFITTYLFF
ncbi:hypothetical protein D9613_006095 [Agrocybe pediades]|uniref:MSP domain-containing protein n=1 Tax=Agrocybe pediades TaxID=84607 RepID=A0A8H4QU54_9AGAR|nr:hypothetical protein D9613_006095 [Agrocybe pediades]